MHRRHGPHLAFPPLLLNVGNRDVFADNHNQNYGTSLLFGSGGTIFLSDNPGDPQAQPQPQGQTSEASPQTNAPSSSADPNPQSTASAASASASTQEPSSSASASSSSSASVSSPNAPSSTPPLQAPSSPSASASPPRTSRPASSNVAQAQSQSQSQSQTSATPIASSAAAPTAAPQSSATLNGSSSGTLSRSVLSSSPPSFAASSTVSSSFSSSSITPSPAPNNAAEGLHHLALVVIGVVSIVSIIAFLATLVSWFYKQRNRTDERAEITTLASSVDDHHGRMFGWLKKRRDNHSYDMSELGFGLDHVDFFGKGNSGDEHHRVGLALGPENVMRDDEARAYDEEKPFQPPREPSAGGGFTDSAYPTVRPLPAHIRGAVDGASSLSLSPYAHLAPARALGGTSATPLTVANLVPGDVSSDEGGHNGSPIARHGSLGTPRMGASAPPFMSLAEGDGLTVPWAPLHVRRGSPGLEAAEKGEIAHDEAEQAYRQGMGFQPLAFSRTSTLSLALSRTFSGRLGHSLSKTADWRDGVTRPPPGTFRAAWDETAPKHENDTDTTSEPSTWAATLKTNLYNALSAVGSSMHSSGSGSVESSLPGPRGSIATLPNPYSEPATSSRRSSMRYLFAGGPRQKEDEPLDDILTPPPARVAAARFGRTKGSIIRGHLGIAPVPASEGNDERETRTGLGLEIDALSRSSTLSTSWSDAGKGPALTEPEIVHRRGLDRDPHRQLTRLDTGSTMPFVETKPNPERRRLGVRNLKGPSRRPRYSRMPMSQSSIWSSESYASTIDGKGRR